MQITPTTARDREIYEVNGKLQRMYGCPTCGSYKHADDVFVYEPDDICPRGCTGLLYLWAPHSLPPEEVMFTITPLEYLTGKQERWR